ncbi:hypothetical protein [Paenimyroides aestuarii]|uniref:Carboxypeptidase-like regulatory domain-containing protein n=1 Tax=Paenimyroides aestuarii TaxID=2968490 RepID=A0ABY5NVR0_9FLAO|nr:hypothetical protein [Paenimyroides aestuarii]UUV22517.1 hypothetical protein NPX36_05610 [Paenimyroides aestuarii]
MKKSIKITIPKPCEKQEWSSEFISNREQLCLLCSEKVFDATNLSDTELHNLVNQRERPKCMKFKQSQLNRPLLVASTNHFNYKQISNAFYGLLVAGLVVSCGVKKRTENAVSACEQLFITDPFFKDTLKYVIRGIVIDNKYLDVIDNADVTIYTNKYEQFAKVDSLGRFKMVIPKSKLSDIMYLKIDARRNQFYVFVYKEHYEGSFEIRKEEFPLNKVFVLKEPEPIYIGYYEVEK